MKMFLKFLPLLLYVAVATRTALVPLEHLSVDDTQMLLKSWNLDSAFGNVRLFLHIPNPPLFPSPSLVFASRPLLVLIYPLRVEDTPARTPYILPPNTICTCVFQGLRKTQAWRSCTAIDGGGGY